VAAILYTVSTIGLVLKGANGGGGLLVTHASHVVWPHRNRILILFAPKTYIVRDVIVIVSFIWTSSSRRSDSLWIIATTPLVPLPPITHITQTPISEGFGYSGFTSATLADATTAVVSFCRETTNKNKNQRITTTLIRSTGYTIIILYAFNNDDTLSTPDTPVWQFNITVI